VHPEREATLQCLVCLRCKVPTHLSYHCGVPCLKRHWNLHKDYHKHHTALQQQAKPNGACLPANALSSWVDHLHLVLWVWPVPALSGQHCVLQTVGDVVLDKTSSLPDSWVEVGVAFQGSKQQHGMALDWSSNFPECFSAKQLRGGC
jgi:hypothetical protein